MPSVLSSGQARVSSAFADLAASLPVAPSCRHIIVVANGMGPVTVPMLGMAVLGLTGLPPLVSGRVSSSGLVDLISSFYLGESGQGGVSRPAVFFFEGDWASLLEAGKGILPRELARTGVTLSFVNFVWPGQVSSSPAFFSFPDVPGIFCSELAIGGGASVLGGPLAELYGGDSKFQPELDVSRGWPGLVPPLGYREGYPLFWGWPILVEGGWFDSLLRSVWPGADGRVAREEARLAIEGHIGVSAGGCGFGDSRMKSRWTFRMVRLVDPAFREWLVFLEKAGVPGASGDPRVVLGGMLRILAAGGDPWKV